MSKIEDLQKEINEIKTRNKKVETDKAWEISKTRKVIIIILTYAVIVIFLLINNLPKPFINAIIPSIAFFVSTLSISIFKKWWITKINNSK